MYCPQCSAEYREGFTQCSTCFVPLVEGDAPEPLPDEQQWTPATHLGSKGTKLIFLYVAQTFIVGAAIIFRISLGMQIGMLHSLGAICGVASGVGIFTRQRFALHLVYGFLAIMLIWTVANILQTQHEGLDSFMVGQIAGGIFLPIAWFFYFRRRRNLFSSVRT